MQNLIAFYLRFRVFLAFAALQFVALYTYISASEFPRVQFLSTSSTVNGKIMDVRTGVTKHFALENANKRLQLENKLLREKLAQSGYKVQKGVTTIDDTVYKQQYTYYTARVVSNTFDKRDNYMTIELGRADGVTEKMGVFSSYGVVGTVALVGEHYSLVKTVLSKNINIDVMLEPGGAFGLLKWDGKHARRAQISGISSDMVVKKWTKVVTRGGSGLFPRGILVGRVEKKSYIEGEPLWNIQVRLAEDLRRIQHVYVVKNLMLEELQKINSAIPKIKDEDEL
jgi:rod shape-determining protein MreC